MGPNGAGKSTLLRLLSGDLEATSGNVCRVVVRTTYHSNATLGKQCNNGTVQVVRNAKLKWARFSQHFVDQLDLSLSPLAQMIKEFPIAPVQDLRAHLGSFGLSGL